MIRKMFLVLLLQITYALATEQAKEDAPKITTGSIMNVVTNQADSIAGLNGNKLYLKRENIFQSKFGYILRNGLSAIVLPRLSFDEKGEGYLLCRSSEDFRLTCSNSRCGYTWWFSETWDIYCPKCGSIGN